MGWGFVLSAVLISWCLGQQMHSTAFIDQQKFYPWRPFNTKPQLQWNDSGALTLTDTSCSSGCTGQYLMEFAASPPDNCCFSASREARKTLRKSIKLQQPGTTTANLWWGRTEQRVSAAPWSSVSLPLQSKLWQSQVWRTGVSAMSEPRAAAGSASLATASRSLPSCTARPPG